MGLLAGKKAAIFGVANERSIAWAISEAFHAEGAELAFTFAGEILEKRVRPLAEGIDFLKSQRGRHFDPRCMDAFLADPARIEAILAEYGD